MNTGVLGTEVIAKYVPYDADLYIETSDFALLGELFMEFDSGYFTLVQDLERNMISHAGVYITGITTEPAMTVVVFPESDAFDIELLAIDQYSWLTTKAVENALLISVKEEDIAASIYARSGLAKNLTQNPRFVTFTQQEVTESKIIIFTSSSEVKAQLILLLSSSESERLGEIAEEYKQTESNFVIL
jgi:hypothetical protein